MSKSPGSPLEPADAAAQRQDGESDESAHSAAAAPSGFPCATCGAPTTWDPDHDALVCAHCGAQRAVPRVEGAILERPLEAAGEALRGLGVETRALVCRNCGAVVALGLESTAARCVFCGSSSVLAQEANRNALRPESLIPLDVGRAAVEANFQRWLKNLWFRPTALSRLKRFEAVGVYVPYWTFDAAVHSKWSADAGHYYWVTTMVPVMVNGKMRMQPTQVRKVRWVPAWGQRDDAYDDLLVNASRGVPDDLAANLGGFDTRALVPYRAEYLAGWRAEEYQLDLAGAWETARARIVTLQEGRCAGDVPGDTHRNLQAVHDIAGVHWKHVLLPLWSLSYEFAGKCYTVLVHGQTGRVHGRAPWSWVKILAAVLAAALAIAIAFLIAELSS
jgi:DNA-directed RNA polymerase subunit RPC12/RpoP